MAMPEVAADHQGEPVGLALEGERGALDLLVVLELDLEQADHLDRDARRRRRCRRRSSRRRGRPSRCRAGRCSCPSSRGGRRPSRRRRGRSARRSSCRAAPRWSAPSPEAYGGRAAAREHGSPRNSANDELPGVRVRGGQSPWAGVVGHLRFPLACRAWLLVLVRVLRRSRPYYRQPVRTPGHRRPRRADPRASCSSRGGRGLSLVPPREDGHPRRLVPCSLPARTLALRPGSAAARRSRTGRRASGPEPRCRRSRASPGPYRSVVVVHVDGRRRAADRAQATLRLAQQLGPLAAVEAVLP